METGIVSKHQCEKGCVMKSDRQVSVVLAGYNEEAIIEKSMQRVVDCLERYFRRWELILIDDASKDATGLLMCRFAENHPDVRVMENGVNLNFGTAVLRGLTQAKYEYVVYNACDLPLTPQDMADAVMHMKDNTDVLVLERKSYGATAWRKITSLGNRLLLRLLFPGLSRGTPDLNFTQIYRKHVICQIIPLARSPIFVWPELVFRARLKNMTVKNKKVAFKVEHIRGGAFGHPHDIIWGIYDMLRFRIRLWKNDI